MALISGSFLLLMWILGHDFSGHYKRQALISVDIISGVYCSILKSQLKDFDWHVGVPFWRVFWPRPPWHMLWWDCFTLKATFKGEKRQKNRSVNFLVGWNKDSKSVTLTHTFSYFLGPMDCLYNWQDFAFYLNYKVLTIGGQGGAMGMSPWSFSARLPLMNFWL